MTHAMIAAAVALAHTLTEENAALRAHDIARAMSLLARKRAEMQSLSNLQRSSGALSPEQWALAQQVAARLADAAAENRRLLERAIAVQGEVIATLLRAVPAALPAARYGAGGARVGQPPPISLSSRV